MQILSVDLGADMVPGLALGAELPARIMNDQPRSLQEHIITPGLLARAPPLLRRSAEPGGDVCLLLHVLDQWLLGQASGLAFQWSALRVCYRHDLRCHSDDADRQSLRSEDGTPLLPESRIFSNPMYGWHSLRVSNSLGRHLCSSAPVGFWDGGLPT